MSKSLEPCSSKSRSIDTEWVYISIILVLLNSSKFWNDFSELLNNVSPEFDPIRSLSSLTSDKTLSSSPTPVWLRNLWKLFFFGGIDI